MPEETSQSLLAILLDYFKRSDWQAEFIPEAGIIAFSFEGEQATLDCYAQARESTGHILFFSVLLYECDQPEQIPYLAEYITRANYDLPLGNFEMDYDSGEVRYKTALNANDITVTPQMLTNMIYTNLVVADTYSAGFQPILKGEMTPLEAIQHAEAWQASMLSDEDERL